MDLARKKTYLAATVVFGMGAIVAFVLTDPLWFSLMMLAGALASAYWWGRATEFARTASR